MARLNSIYLYAVLTGFVLPLHPLFADGEAGFIRIFDGQTLAGWTADEDFWCVENGAIVGKIPAGQELDHNTWIVWDGGVLEDFELRVEFRLTGKPAANSGIQFRCQVDDVNHVSGYQADLDMGATWLGRIYDEHGRALLTERGTRVLIQEDGKRLVEKFADPAPYAVLFRDNQWNDYRIRACGKHMTVEINGTLFSELVDQQQGESDAAGRLAFQLHSGPETRIEFRNIRYRTLKPGEHTVHFRPAPEDTSQSQGVFPSGDDGRALNLGFEEGSLRDWSAVGAAFEGQPLKEDGISQRWPGQSSRKADDYFVAGYEIVRDAAVGELRSVPFTVTHPYASYLLGGGAARSTRCEVMLVDESNRVIHTASGANREQMERVLVDLRPHQGARIQLRLVDENPGPWGHLNFDDFRFHAQEPVSLSQRGPRRVRENPILSHLQANPVSTADTVASADKSAAETLVQMYLPPGFTAELIAAEPRVHQPIAFTIDESGRLWVVEGNSYPQKRPAGEGADRILIFADEDGDGQFETRKVFIEGLNLVSGLQVGYGGVWVGAAPELLYIPDRDRNDQPDAAPQVLLDGFGFQDTHETLNNFVWGPDGWLYGNQGVFNYARIGKPGTPEHQRVELRAGVWRYHPVRHEFEVFAHGGSNQWGLDFDQYGQLFMTHCRSYWGRGSTTHVIQGGHYWNQANRNYASFVSANAPAGYPHLRNYLLASSRYGHGEGGAGKPGSRAVYGGHSHVGTMIYLGDNWPADYRGRLFSHNLHGRQINQQINLRDGSGFNTVHAGQDVFYCDDPYYVAVDLQYGPDGAVYTTDWYDQRNCHNPNVELWDRSNGRIYRIAYAATYRPVRTNLARLSDAELVQLQLHQNDWFVRTARRLLHERAAGNRLTNPESTRGQLAEMAMRHPDATRRLRALWALHAMDGIDGQVGMRSLSDPNEYVRGWAIQLISEGRGVTASLRKQLVDMARHDPSPVVRLFLASAMQRVAPETGWQLAEALAQHAEDVDDRNLPRMVWYGVASLLPDDEDRTFQLARNTQLPMLAQNTYWYAAKRQGTGLDRVIQMIAAARGEAKRDLLEGAALALGGQRGLPMPASWAGSSAELYQSPDRRVRFLAENLGAAFGDESLYAAKRRMLADTAASLKERRHAFTILAGSFDRESLPLLLELLDDNAFRSAVIPQLARFDDPAIGQALVARFSSFSDADAAAALDALVSRESLAHVLLDAVAAGQIDKSSLTAYYVRQLVNLNSPALDERLARQWGKVARSSAEKQQQIAALEKAYAEAPLWAYSLPEGQKHFQQLCATCHDDKDETKNIGPKLQGSGTKGVRYFLENIVDPSAVIGSDFQMQLVETDDGRLISGIVEETTDSTITVRTQTESIVVPRDEIDSLTMTQLSLMPEGMLETLNARQQIELFLYLNSL